MPNQSRVACDNAQRPPKKFSVDWVKKGWVQKRVRDLEYLQTTANGPSNVETVERSESHSVFHSVNSQTNATQKGASLTKARFTSMTAHVKSRRILSHAIPDAQTRFHDVSFSRYGQVIEWKPFIVREK